MSTLTGVEACAINFATGKLRVDGDIEPGAVIERVERLGYRAEMHAPGAFTPPVAPTAASLTGVRGFVRWLWRRSNTRLALVGALLILPGLIFQEILPLFGIEFETRLFNLTSMAALLVAGAPVARNAFRVLWINRRININLLMTIAAVGAVVIGAYTEAGLVMVLFAIGEALEGYSAERGRDAIRRLMEVAPSQALVLRPCMNCAEHLGVDGYEGGPCPLCGLEEHLLLVTEIVVGDQMVVKPGERIAMDGQVINGASQVNQAPITGESIPVEKTTGDEVFAGSINGAGALAVRVTRLAADNAISRIIRLVEEAQEQRAPVQTFVDRFAAIYTPAVVAAALLIAILPPLLFGAPFWGEQGWLYRSLELLVVACPCALVISTPVSLVSAISSGAAHGVLIKGGAALQTLSRVNVIAFDKTGTLTQGRPQVIRVRSIQCQTVNQPGITCDPCSELLALATAVERRSEHPLARAVTSHAADLGVEARYPAAEGVQSLVGRGVQGQVNGRRVLIGSHAYLDHAAPHSPTMCDELNQAARAGQTTLTMSVDDRFAGYISVADTARAESQSVLAKLHELGVREVVMLTGDDAATGRAVAASVGITNVRAGLLPEEKVAAIRELRIPAGRTVAMVGDGINDAPALAAADVGIAMGGAGSPQAMETADVVLMADELTKLPFVLGLSRAAMGIIRFNVFFSVALKLIVFGLVLVGLGSMWMAVLADVGAALLVTANGMRLLRFKG